MKTASTVRTETALPDDNSPFHDGEKAVQERVGVRDLAERVGRAIIRDHMPAQHRTFFANLPYLVVGTVDAQQRPWASFLAGAPGFVAAQDEHTLCMHTEPLAGDLLAERLEPGAEVAVLGIELHTRRRNRANGWVTTRDRDSFSVHVAQSFGNCPKHITPRVALALASGQARPAASVSEEGALLSARARQQIAHSDTFFIASAAQKEPAKDTRLGLDVSHRGGHVGFVAIEQAAQETVLSFLDYSGNNVFNTLGNIVRNPVVGLTFVDFERGDVLMLTGRATVDFTVSESEKRAGGERKVRITIDEGRLLQGALPFAFRAV
jgi:predicted pyridoxine 5'-phosphate oxidase superfamily flavin-nucleotide-binding protein